MNYQVEQIKAYIEKLLECTDNSSEYMDGRWDALVRLRDYINGLQEEPVSEDLEEELNKWRHSHFHGRRDVDASGEYLERVSQLDLARHFANWQKQQMMKDSKERVVRVDADGYPYINGVEFWDYDKDVPLAKAGDKVKLIIIKDENL